MSETPTSQKSEKSSSTDDSDLEFWEDVKKGVTLVVDTNHPSSNGRDSEPNSALPNMRRHVSTLNQRTTDLDIFRQAKIQEIQDEKRCTRMKARQKTVNRISEMRQEFQKKYDKLDEERDELVGKLMLKDIALSEMHKKTIDLITDVQKLRVLTEKPPAERAIFRKTSLLASIDAPVRRRKPTAMPKGNLSPDQQDVKIKTLESQLKTANEVWALYQKTDEQQKQQIEDLEREKNEMEEKFQCEIQYLQHTINCQEGIQKKEIQKLKAKMLGEKASIKHELEIMQVLKKRKEDHIEFLKNDLATVTSVACNPRLKNQLYSRLSDAANAGRALDIIATVDGRGTTANTANESKINNSRTKPGSHLEHKTYDVRRTKLRSSTEQRHPEDRIMTAFNTRHKSKESSPSNWGRRSYNNDDELALKIFRAKSTKYKGVVNANRSLDFNV